MVIIIKKTHFSSGKSSEYGRLGDRSDGFI
jgi:hypothetical protein